VEVERRAAVLEERRKEVNKYYLVLCREMRIFVPYSAILEFPSFLEVTNNYEEEINDENWAIVKNELLHVNAHVKHRIMEATIEVWKSKKPIFFNAFDFSMIETFLAADPANNSILDETCLDRPNVLFSNPFCCSISYDELEERFSSQSNAYYWHPRDFLIALPVQEAFDLINALCRELPDVTRTSKGAIFICKRCEYWHKPMTWMELVWRLLTCSFDVDQNNIKILSHFFFQKSTIIIGNSRVITKI